MPYLLEKYTIKKLLVYPGMLMVMLLAFGCDKECQEDEVETYYMPDSQKAMVPYETGDTLVFLYEHNSQKDTVTFTGKKERNFEENEEMITDCPSYRIEKYEQFHYNFYSKDSAHQLKITNYHQNLKGNKSLKSGIIDISFKDINYGVPISHWGNTFTDKNNSDTILHYRMIDSKIINTREYYNIFFKMNEIPKEIMYNKTEGLLLLSKNNNTLSLITYK